MSSNCPPQIHLTLPANTTSFKRSFEQFGFDLESPTGGGEAGAGSSSSRRNTGGSSLSGNERNKRARSASSLSDGNDSLRSSRSSTFTSGSSDTIVSEDSDPQPGPSGLSATRPAAITAMPPSGLDRSLDPPRLPTPDLPDIQDIEMPDYQLEDDQLPAQQSPTERTSTSIENYRLSLSRFNSFDSHIAALRRSRSPSLHRIPTPPPTLPPLSLTEDPAAQETSLSPHTQPTLEVFGSTHAGAAPSSSSSQQRPSNSNRDDTLTDAQDPPPILPSPIHHSPVSLSAPLLAASPLPTAPSPPASRPPVINLDVEESTSRDEDLDYVSFRERLNNAVELLETDDLHSFRERLSSALDAVRPAPANRSSRNTHESRERSAPQAFAPLSSTSMSRSSSSGHSSGASSGILQRNGSDSSSSWRTSLMIPSASSSGAGGRSSRLRDLFGASSSSSSGASSLRLLGTPEARSGSSAPALFIPSLPMTPLGLDEGPHRDDDLSSVADREEISDDNEISSTAANSSTSSSRTTRTSFHLPASSPQPSQLPRSSHQSSANASSSQSRPLQLFLRGQIELAPYGSSEDSGPMEFGRDFMRWFEPTEHRPTSAGATPPEDSGSLDFERDFGRWFEPTEVAEHRPTSTGTTPPPIERNEGNTPGQALDEDEDLDGWRYLSRNEVRRRNRPLTLPPFTPLSTNLRGSSTSTTAAASIPSLAERLGYSEEGRPPSGAGSGQTSSARRDTESTTPAPSSLLASTASNAATAGSNYSGSSTRAPPSLTSLIARDSMDSLGDDSGDTSEQDMDVDVDTRNNHVMSRSGESMFGRPFNAVSRMERRAEARERFFDNARRYYLEHELLDRETTERPEERRDGNEGSNSAGAGYRLTAHEDESRRSSSAPTPLRWQLRWNELEQGLDFSPADEDEDSDTGRDLSESERIWRISRRIGRGLRNGAGSRSNLLDESNGSRDALTARSQATGSDMGWRLLPGADSSFGSSSSLAHRRARSRMPSSTRPGASNTLMAENAAELRRQSAHADLMDHLQGHSYTDSTSRDLNHLRASFSLSRRPDASRNETLHTRSGSMSSPVLPPLSYQYRSSSPQESSHSFAETLMENIRERELQDERNHEEPPQRLSRRSTSLSWLPPAQNTTASSGSPFLSTLPFVESIGVDVINAMEDGSSSPGERFRRRSRLPSWADHPSSRSPPRSARPEPAPRTHMHSSSWSSFARARAVPESAAFFDSQRSSISDMARTIADNDNIPRRDLDFRPFSEALPPSSGALASSAPSNRRTTRATSDDDSDVLREVPEFGPFSEAFPPSPEPLASGAPSSRITNNTSAPSHPVQHPSSQGYRSTAQRHHNMPPLIPPPDLGDMMLVPDPDNVSGNLTGPESPEDPLEFPRMTPADYVGFFGLNDNVLSPPPRSTSQVRSSSSALANASSGGSGRYNIDVDSFAPGPFQNTMRRLIDRERSRNVPSEPPSIPPLAFEDDFLPPRSSMFADSLDSYNARAANQRRNESNSQFTYNTASRDPFGRRNSTSTSLNRPPPPRYAQRLRSPDPELESNRRRPDDLHRLMTSRARLEASLLDGSVPSSGQAPPSHGDLAGLNHAIEVLRPDGLSETRSHQLINRYRETRINNSSPFSSSTSLWGNLESDRNSNNNSNRLLRYPTSAWYRRLNDNALNGTASSTATDTRAGTTATRRRPSPPGRVLDRSEALHESRANSIGRGRFSARNARHRLPEFNSFGDRDPAFNDFLAPFARLRRGRGAFSLGDFIRDEDFDTSYEGLISLEATLGEVKSRSTPDHVVASLEAGFFKDWATEDCDQRCPICLDDYKSLDPVLKLNDCSHWLHKSCLEQWLKGASTCPVCRKAVKGVPAHRHPRLRAQRPSLSINTGAGPSRFGNAGRSNAGPGTSSGNTNNNYVEAGNGTNANVNNTDTSSSSSTARRTHAHYMPRPSSP